MIQTSLKGRITLAQLYQSYVKDIGVLDRELESKFLAAFGDLWFEPGLLSESLSVVLQL